ncbi:tetratricopeptide repeat protein [Actinomadura decatromicini]|uniref:tetratricopeptide repeat protein n=1 Tax=Actinomadura decatromicini TaxID=2604572 RepID=UPI00165338C4|nr:tetratricopeptide repeat protein [Actinomadura decatromicini]
MTVLDYRDGCALSYAHDEPSPELHHLLWRLERAKAGRVTSADISEASAGSPGALGARLSSALRAVGGELGRHFLGPEIAQAVAEALANATGAGEPLRISLEIDGELAGLPWEAITLPGQDTPLVLTAAVELYRAAAVQEATPPTLIPPPLRVLVAIASPDHGGGALLDYETELSRILDSVEAIRSADSVGGGSHVRVLNWGSRAAIRKALLDERFHVLHITCHGAAGSLLLESGDGGPDRMDATEFVTQVLVPDRPVPLIVLAACSTAAPVVGESTGAEWRGMAQTLLAEGVSAVLAMTNTVSDPYATELLSAFYAELAGQSAGDALAALSEARRIVERDRAARTDADPRAALSEWATPVLFHQGSPEVLFDPDADAEPVRELPLSALTASITVRGAEHFVGRRAELRQLLRTLRFGTPAVVIHGLGGVGKSTLAGHVVLGLDDRAGIVISLSGATNADQILLAFADRLASWCATHDIAMDDDRRGLVEVLRDGHRSWQDRLAVVGERLLATVSVTLVLDDFDDNLVHVDGGPDHMIGDGSLVDLLAEWPTLTNVYLILTSRYSFAVPGDARFWQYHHLGPLSSAECRKLVWRLPALDALSVDEQRRAIADVGGHPRALEYLDALLRAGNARFTGVADRLEAIIREHDVPDPRARPANATEFDRRLAEAVDIAAADILLTDLLACLDSVPYARRLLIGASVYRQPVDETGLLRQVSEEQGTTVDPLEEKRSADLARRVSEALPNWRELGSAPPENKDGLLPDLEELYEHFERLRRPSPAPDAFERALATLLDLGLLTPLPGTDGTPVAYYVHRWTAAAIAQLVTSDELTDAHRRAATDYCIRILPLMDALRFSLDNRDRVINQLEAAHHQIMLGEPAEDMIEGALTRLHAWGMWDWEERVCRDTLSEVPEHSTIAASLHARIGVIAFDRGDLATAEARYREALTINEAQGDQYRQGSDYQELGMIAHARADWVQAEELFQQALTRFTEPGRERDRANVYNSLGIVAIDRGDYAQAEEWFGKSVPLAEQVEDRGLLANALGELGIIARLRGDLSAAEQWCRQSMELKATTGNRLAYARGIGELALIASARGNHSTARDLLHRALRIFDELGHPEGVALTYANLGDVARATHNYASAERWFTEAATLAHELGMPMAAGLYDALIRLAVRREDYHAGQAWAQLLVELHKRIGSPDELAEACHAVVSFCTVNQDISGAIVYTVHGLAATSPGTPLFDQALKLPRSLRVSLGRDEFRRMLAEILSSAEIDHLLTALDRGSSSP